MWALITLILLNVFGLGVALAKHGTPQPNYNFWVTLFSNAVAWWLLYEAGLFDQYIK